jgi:hypothetical protein
LNPFSTNENIRHQVWIVSGCIIALRVKIIESI